MHSNVFIELARLNWQRLDLAIPAGSPTRMQQVGQASSFATRQSSDWLRRRGQVVVLLQAQKQQAAMAPPSVRKLAARTIAALVRELGAIEKMMKALIREHATPALRSSKGLGPVFQATVLSLLPELGHLDRRQI